MYDKNSESNWNNFLQKDGVSPIHVAELSHLLLLSVELQDTQFQRSEFSVINTDNPEDIPAERDLVVSDKDGLKLNLRIHYQYVSPLHIAKAMLTGSRMHAESGGAFRVQVYTPYLLINKTGCNFTLKTKTLLSSAKSVAGQDAAGNKDATPFMFSFPSDDRRNRVLLRINDSAWSKVRMTHLSAAGSLLRSPSASRPSASRPRWSFRLHRGARRSTSASRSQRDSETWVHSSSRAELTRTTVQAHQGHYDLPSLRAQERSRAGHPLPRARFQRRCARAGW